MGLKGCLIYKDGGYIFEAQSMKPLDEFENELWVSVIEKPDSMFYFKRACEITSKKKMKDIRAVELLPKMYKAEHSPIRQRQFWIEVHNCPTFVANHFRTHHVGKEQYSQSHRSDRSGVKDTESTRLTPTVFGMDINAQALINMSRKRLCYMASKETRLVMEMIKHLFEIYIDPALAECMVPECEYRKGCHEMDSCGRYRDAKNNKKDKQ